MPPPVSYLDVTAVPFSQTVTQAQFNGGTYGGSANTTWVRYVTASNIVLGTYTDKGGTFQPRVRLYANNSGAMTLKTGVADAQAFWWVISAGETYWLEIVNIHPSSLLGPSDFDFTTRVETAAILTSVPAGSIVINDDQESFPAGVPDAQFPATVMTSDGTFLGFLTGIPGGEIGDSLPDGTALYNDEFGTFGGPLALFDPSSVYIVSGDTSPSSAGGTAPVAIGNDGSQFYVVNRGGGAVYTVSSTGTISAQIATIGIVDRPASAIGVSRDGTIMYWAEGDGYNGGFASIHRHNLLTDTPMSNLYDIPALDVNVGWVATTGVNNQPGEILVLGDDSIVTWYRDDGLNTDNLLHISDAGALLSTKTYSHPSRIDHIAYVDDGSLAVRVWTFEDDYANSGRFETITLATGAASTSINLALFSAGVNMVVNDSTIFGPSTSCTMVTSSYTMLEVEPPEPEPPGTPPPVPSPCDCPNPEGSVEPPDDTIFAGSAWIPQCGFGGMVPSASDLANSELWDPQ